MRERGLGDSSSSSRFSPEPAGMRWRVESEARCELVSRGSLTTGAAPQPGQPTWPPPLNCRFEKLFPTTGIFVCPPEHHPRMVSYAAKPQQCGLFYLCSPTSITVTAAGGGVVQLRQSKPPWAGKPAALAPITGCSHCCKLSQEGPAAPSPRLASCSPLWNHLPVYLQIKLRTNFQLSLKLSSGSPCAT